MTWVLIAEDLLALRVRCACMVLCASDYRDSRVPAWKRRPREADLIPLHAAIRNGITCGLANAWWLGWFILSLEKTSIGHACVRCHGQERQVLPA